MADFSTIGGKDSIPYQSNTPEQNALNLSNPDDILTGTQRGQQSLGAPNIKTDSANQRIVVNDNTTNRVSFGKIGTGVNDWGLKVSKPSFNVDTATANQLIFNSSQNVFKIVGSGSETFPVFSYGGSAGNFSNSSQAKSIPHNLGYTPAILAYVSTGGEYYQTPYILNSGAGGTASWSTYTVSVNETNVNLFVFLTSYGTGFNSVGLTCKYYLLQETAN